MAVCVACIFHKIGLWFDVQSNGEYLVYKRGAHRGLFQNQF